MSIAKWATPGARSANLAGSAINSLATGSETSSANAISYDNGTNRDVHAIVTVKLASLTPAAGGSISLRVYSGDGIDAPDIGGGERDEYVLPLASGTGVKTVTFKMVRLYPFSNMRFTVVNNAGVSTAASGHEFFVRPYNEDVS
jgi:hypothetical protein